MSVNPPHAILLIATGCAHCPVVMDALMKLIKQGKLRSIEVFNIQFEQTIAKQEGVRQVPWVKINEFAFTGKLTEQELAYWAKTSQQDNAKTLYFSWLIENQAVDTVITWLNKQPEDFNFICDLVLDKETPMAVRIGLNIIFESFESSPFLEPTITLLSQNLNQQPANIRGDICYYLGLSHQAETQLKAFLNDENADVREIVEEALNINQT